MNIIKNKSLGIIMVWLLFSIQVKAQKYPFQNIKLSDDKRIDNLISLMTLDEKLDNLSPRLAGIPRLGVNGTRTVEGLHGLAWSGPANWAVKGKYASPTTIFPQAIGLAETWDPVLIKKVASWEADEARFMAQNQNFGNGGLIVFAPNADLGRDIRWGRTEECYGEDAYLASRLVVAFVEGLQGNDERYWKSASLMKHFLANSNENDRFINSSDFDDRLFREYYSYAFYKGVTEGGSRAYMAAYNKYNGVPCTVNPVLKNVTVQEWGQDGIIATDGGAFSLLISAHHYYDNTAEAAASCIKAGINMFLDRYKEAVQVALTKEFITEKDIDAAIRGPLRVMLKLGLMDDNPKNPYINLGVQDTIRPWTKPEASELVRKVTDESIVLLKNEGLLPIHKDKVKSIAVIGPGADFVVSDWYTGTPPYKVSILDGIKNALGDDVKINYASGNMADSAVIAAKESDVAIVCIGNDPLRHGLGWGKSNVASDGSEAVDRQAITTEQEDLVKLVKAANPKTVLIMVASFPYAIPWSKENVPSILRVTQSSQELGNGIADVLFGKVSPAGRLVQTWPSSIEHLLPILDYNIRDGRTYMYDKEKPLFAFGHGLSYTSFKYSDIILGKPTIIDGEVDSVSVNISNTGPVNSDEVVQLYVSFPDSKVDRPNLALKGFKRIYIPAGQMVNVKIPLDADELKYWNVEQHKWVLEPGKVQLMVGAASDDIRQKGTLEVE